MKKMIFLFLLLSFRVFSQEKEVWIQKPMEAWPQIAMINEVWYEHGERYVHPSFEYVATGFLIDTGEDTLAVTAKHVLWVAKTSTLNRVDITFKIVFFPYTFYIANLKGDPDRASVAALSA